MSNKKLHLDKHRLLRLQDQQLNATVGGADWESNTARALAATDPSDEPSCCKKSCNNRPEPDTVDIL